MGVALVLLASLSDGAAHRSVLDEASWGSAGGVGALRSAANDHGLRVGELDVNVLLVDARELAVELVGVVGLADIELGLPAGDVGSATALALTRVVVKVVKEAEEGSEGSVGVVEVSGEESHFEVLVVG